MAFNDTPETLRAYRRAYYARNKDKWQPKTPEAKEQRRAYMKAWQASHKEDQQAKRKAWRAANKEKLRELHRAWKKANPEKVKAGSRRYWNKNKHAIIERQRPLWEKNNRERPAVILARQESTLGRQRPEVCDICGDKDWRIVFDHCHAKGHARGWLCDGCNKGLGSFRDDPERLIKAAAYLKRYAHVVDPQLAIPGI